VDWNFGVAQLERGLVAGIRLEGLKLLVRVRETTLFE
jgi:hypothetical protein